MHIYSLHINVMNLYTKQAEENVPEADRNQLRHVSRENMYFSENRHLQADHGISLHKIHIHDLQIIPVGGIFHGTQEHGDGTLRFFAHKLVDRG